jgi:hypothetical protein
MIPMLRLVAILVVASAGEASAQAPAPAPAAADSAVTEPNAVTTYAIRSGRLMLSSKANPKPTPMPDGTYTNQADLILVFLDGRVTRVQESTDRIMEIASMHLNRQKLVKLMLSTNALMAVSEMTLPSGTFKSHDGLSSVTIVFGRPTEFILAPGA